MAIHLRGTQSDQLIRMALANVERSKRPYREGQDSHAAAPAQVVEIPLEDLDRCAVVSGEGERVHPRCRRLGEGPCGSSVPTGTKGWLLAIASVIKDWQTMPKDEM